MGRRRTFAEVVAEVRETVPAATEQRDAVFDLTKDTWRGPGGVVWHAQNREITPSLAAQLVRDGALVAWDCCGCGGYCGLRWLDAEARSRLGRAQPRLPRRKRSWGALSSWRSADGQLLVLAEGGVEWGRELA